MKRILSLVICACLMISLLPSLSFFASAHSVVMTSNEFIAYLQYVVDRGDSKYGSGGQYSIGKYEGGHIYFDCWGLGESIICTNGQIVYNRDSSLDPWNLWDTSCGCGSKTGDWLEDQCQLSSDFSSITPGEWLFWENTSGTCRHVGYFIGDGKVIESTTDGSNNTQVSGIDSSGHSIISGRGSGWTWTYHGKVPWIEYEPDITYLIKESLPSCCTLKITDPTCKIKSLPCSVNTDSSSETVEVPSVNDKYTAVKLYKNTAGNYWYKVQCKNGQTGYLYSGDCSLVSKLNDVTGNGIGAPSSITLGSSYPVTGTVQTVGNKISQVSVYVYAGTATSGTAITGDYANIDTYSYNLANLDSNVRFNDIPSTGTYNYVVKAKIYGYAATTPTSAGQYSNEFIVKQSTFTVTSGGSDPGASTLSINPTTIPSGNLTPGEPFSLRGTVSSNYKVTRFEGTITEASEGPVQTIITFPNAYTVDIRSSDVNQLLDFSTYPTGKYKLHYYAEDASGNKVSWDSDWFWIGETVENKEPDKPVIAPLEPVYLKNQSITIKWTYGENTTHCNYWLYKKNGDSWEFYKKTDYATSPVTEALGVGDYRVLVVATNSNAWNAAGTDWLWTNSDYAYFSVAERITFDPQGGTFPATCKSMDLSNINGGRGYDELTVFTGDGETVNTNIYGYEVAVDSNGLVTDNRLYGDDAKHLVIPQGGFVLSAHNGTSNPAAAFVAGINIGEYVAYDSISMKAYHYTDYEEYLSQQKRVRTNGSYGNLPVPTKEGYYFNGWLDENGQVVDYYKELTSTNLTAQWADDTTPAAADVIWNNHRYIRYEYNMTWESAKNFCEAHGGHLVTITSFDEQQVVEYLLDGGRNIIYFTGCNDAAEEDNWVWVTGEPFSYNNWDPQLPEPDGSEAGYNYGGIVNKAIGANKQFGEWLSNYNYPDNLSWGYRLCNYGFICEIDTICDHHYIDAVTEPTCTEQGYTTHTCEYCGDSYVDTYVPALKHDLIHHEAQAPTCTEIGWEAYDTCRRCDYSTYVEIKALDHDLIHHEAQAPTCTEIGWEAYDTCSRCDYSTYVEIKALDHDLIYHEAQAATCTEIGWEAYDTCSRCDYTTYVEIKELGHDLIHHEAQAPTCTEIGWEAYDTCSRCDYSTYVEKAAFDHDYKAVVTAPTCTEKGYTTYTCSRCGDSYVTDEITANGHKPGTPVEENRVNPTCTETGSFDTVTYCSVCAAELTRVHTELAALDHAWDDGVIDPAATCSTNGIKTFTCRRCGEKKTETIAASGHTPGESAKENEVAATCTTAGSYDMVIRCTTCNEILYTEHYESAALGHDWDDGEVTTPATATTDGIKTFTCKRCGATKTEAIPATGEDACKHENTHPEHKDATCVEAGYDKMICDKCGAVISEETIPALGHDLVADEAVAATCTATGLTAGEHCTRCDYKVAQETVPALGHDWDEGKVTTPATETTNGVKTFTCKRCGATKTETIPATGGEDKPCDGGKDCPSYKFTDVKAGDWYHAAVDFAVKTGLFNGMSDTTFEPNTPMTRGMLVTVLWRYEGQPEGGVNQFADVKDGVWYAKAVAWAASKGIVNGVARGKFDPNGRITREQMAAILYRYSEYKTYDTGKRGDLTKFPDASKVSAYANDAIAWAVGEGLIGGNVINGKTLLDPQGNATRAQVATILMRYIKNIAE